MIKNQIVHFTSVYFYEGKSYAWYLDTDGELQTHRIAPHFDIDVSLGYHFDIDRIKTNLQISGYNLLDNAGYQYYYLKKRYIQASLVISY